MASVFLKNSDYCYFRWDTDSKWTHEIFLGGEICLKTILMSFFGMEAGSDHLVFFLLVCF